MYFINHLAIILMIWNWVSASDLNHLRCPPSPSNCTKSTPTYWSENLAFFTLDGDATLTVGTKESEFIKYTCISGTDVIVAGYIKSIPIFDRVQHFEKVTLSNCGLPEESYRATTDALNISGFNHLSLVFNDKQMPSLPPDHFVGLHDLLTLHITSYSYKNNFDFNFLKHLQNLNNLELEGVTVPPFPKENHLKSIGVTGGTPLNKLQQWGGCLMLEDLKIKDWNSIELPDNWLAKCSQLTSVHIENVKGLGNLPQNMFNSIHMRTIKLIKCGINDLPKGFFDHTSNLRVLDLSKNNLYSIKNDTFSSIILLETLILNDNKLFEPSIINLAPLQFLKTLNLDNNFRFVTCDLQDKVTGVYHRQWPLLASLEHLSLDESKVTKICPYWNESMPKLKHLNLARSLITELKYPDIELIRIGGWNVDLRYSDLDAIVFTESDYEAVLNLPQTSTNATIRIILEVYKDCDCRWYWFARAVKERPGYISITDLSCLPKWGNLTEPVPLETMTLDSFICEEHDCEPGCLCFNRAPDNTTQVNCIGAGLDHIPRMPFLRELHMAYNNIKTIYAYNLPETLEITMAFFFQLKQYLDLQNNQLSTLDIEIAAMMFNRSTTVYNLENNNILCDCNNNALITLLQKHKNQLENYEHVTCADRSLLQHANTFILCLKEDAPVIAGVFSAIILICLIFIAIYYRYKTQIYVILYAWGWCAWCVNEQELDKDKIYDVFISFAHEDTAFVMDQLVPELEKEPQAFTVCVHYRDWVPGEWIPTQIAHSVHQSRRTIIVLSKNFLQSIWALLEFRTAHIQAMKDGRVRLIIILLGDVINSEGMDNELRAYLTTNTYIKWGDAMFWDKLRYALPHRGRKDRRSRAAGEEVLMLARATDPSIVLRNMRTPNNNIMLSIEPA